MATFKTVSILVSRRIFWRYSAVWPGVFMRELRKNCWSRGSVHVLQAFVVKRIVHSLFYNACNWYDDRRTWQNGFYDLFELRFVLYETGQVNFGKDVTLFGMDEIPQGLFHDVKPGQFKSPIREGITWLYSVFKWLCDWLDYSTLDPVLYIGYADLMILITSVLVTTSRSASTV